MLGREAISGSHRLGRRANPEASTGRTSAYAFGEDGDGGELVAALVRVVEDDDFGGRGQRSWRKGLAEAHACGAAASGGARAPSPFGAVAGGGGGGVRIVASSLQQNQRKSKKQNNNDYGVSKQPYKNWVIRCVSYLSNSWLSRLSLERFTAIDIGSRDKKYSRDEVSFGRIWNWQLEQASEWIFALFSRLSKLLRLELLGSFSGLLQTTQNDSWINDSLRDIWQDGPLPIDRQSRSGSITGTFHLASTYCISAANEKPWPWKTNLGRPKTVSLEELNLKQPVSSHQGISRDH
ncbi:hypothetical protein STAS_29971 [Striga asiatica]|uniref:Uncharacterized protein n=1 Tax=Striga asiatica TaxID=4170 RepID=A0A5A7R888_STRAF|nr:hypothetical protein STAS_29971 [Striga asiatica]